MNQTVLTRIGFVLAGVTLGIPMLGTAGCRPATTAPAVAPGRPVFYVAARTDRVWMAMLGLITEVGLPVDTLDRASGFMHTRDSTLTIGDATAIDCGQSDHPRNSQIAVSAQLSIRMRPIKDSTALEIQAAFRGRPRKGGQAPASSLITCTSSGWFETHLVTMLQARSGASISTRNQAPAPTLTNDPVPASAATTTPTVDRVRTDSLYPWIGSTSTSLYYRAGCEAANQVRPDDRVFLSSRETAIAMGFSRSRAPGC